MKQYFLLATIWLLGIPTLSVLGMFGRMIFVKDVGYGAGDYGFFLFLSIFTTPAIILLGKYWWQKYVKAS